MVCSSRVDTNIERAMQNSYVTRTLTVANNKKKNGTVVEIIRSGVQTGIAVGDVNCALKRSSEKNSNDALPGVTRHPIVVVDDAQQHKRMHHHLLDRPRRYLLRFYNVHCLSISTFSSPFFFVSLEISVSMSWAERKLDSIFVFSA